MRVPTDKEIEEAKEYLRQRLDAELSMRTNLQIVWIWISGGDRGKDRQPG